MRDLTTELLDLLTTEEGIVLVTEEPEAVICTFGVDTLNEMCGRDRANSFDGVLVASDLCGSVRSNTFDGGSRSNTFRRRREPTQ